MKLNKMASRREFLEQMPTQELDKMLQTELQKETLDDDLVRLILDVLESREMDYPVEYNPEVIDVAHTLENMDLRSTAKVKCPRVLKAASILLVVGLLLFALPKAVHAENIFELLARWTDSVFEIFNPAKPNDQPDYVFETSHPGLQQIHDAVVELGVTDPVVPTWIPDGYELAECKLIETPKKLGVYARLKRSASEIVISVDVYSADIVRAYTKDGTDVEEIEISGMRHYLFTNHDVLVDIWTVDNIKCSIFADCQEDDFFQMLKSIYMMED